MPTPKTFLFMVGTRRSSGSAVMSITSLHLDGLQQQQQQ
jgi:hypothetical protein